MSIKSGSKHADTDLEHIDYKAFFQSLYDPDMRKQLQETTEMLCMVAREKIHEFIKDGQMTPEQISKSNQLFASMVQNSGKNNSNSYSLSNNSLPKKCIHFQSKYEYSSKIFINYVTHCLTNTKFCSDQQNNYSKVLCYAKVFCLQCCLEFVICTKKFELLLSQMQNNLKILHHQNNLLDAVAELHQSIHIVIMLDAILSNNAICKYFCATRKRKNVIILLQFLKQLYIIFSEKGILKTIDPFSRMSNLLLHLMICMKKNHWKYFVKLELPQLLCDIICSDTFKKPQHRTQDINNNIYQLFEYQI
eukprot:149259_1